MFRVFFLGFRAKASGVGQCAGFSWAQFKGPY